MAHGHHDTGLTWDWDSVLLLSNPALRPSPAPEANGSKSSGPRELLGSTALPSSDRHDRHDKLHRHATFSNRISADSNPSGAQQHRSTGGEGRRDPRLDCPNFLAGRVPCACTDNDDDDDSGVSRKRSKPVPRCQVATCGTELTDLKGYHQRHRVCLRCAHATRVILRDQPHRYCQQCGKFHPICDFDEGKRSCRRKLEKHNNRRRRKAGEVGLSALDAGDADLPNEGSPAEFSPGTNITIGFTTEGEPKPLDGERSSFDAEQTEESVLQTPEISSNEKLSVTVKEPELPTPPDSIESSISFYSSASANLDGNMTASESMRNCTEKQSSQEQTCHTAPFALEPHKDSVARLCPGDFSLHSRSALQAIERAPMRRGNDEESLLALLMEDNDETDHSPLSDSAGEHLLSTPAQLWEPCTSITKQVSYSSPLPTGRISFKLYDWNPGDFPRQLRQQVLDWLSKMPADLEGYIRSGCTILTIFIAMAQQGWDQLNADWAGSVLQLVKSEQSLFRFWSSGYLVARLDDHVVHISDGELAHTICDGVGEPPMLHRVLPLCIEAGSEEEVVILGKGIRQPEARLLVSFDGKYIMNDAYQSGSQTARKGVVAVVDETDTSQEAKLVVRMPALHPKKHGTAYIEVQHMAGTSNFIPLLVAEKGIVDEVRSLQKEMDMRISCCAPNTQSSSGSPVLSQSIVHNLLLDLGWVLKSTSLKAMELDSRAEILELRLGRLRRLLFFALERSWCRVVERVLQLAKRSGLMERVGVLENGSSALQFAVMRHDMPMVEHLMSCVESSGVRSQCKCWWDLDFLGSKGVTAFHSLALEPGARSLCDLLLKRKGVASMWSSVQDNRGCTPEDYALSAGQPSFRIQMGNDLSHNNDSTSTAVTDIAISHDLRFQNENMFSRGKGGINFKLPGLPAKVSTRTLAKRSRRQEKFPVTLGIFGYDPSEYVH